ncbi:MAG: STAS domain-containing protein [FCB group bacterium]|jgi:anti-sigma B factor antagonist|nr:STAS domain-containing protein [FCB group bacterium]
MPLQIDKENSSDRYVVSVHGEVDLYSSPELREVLTGNLPSGVGSVCVDLSGVPYMDSSGVATLVEGLRAAKAASVTFVVVAPSAQVRKVLELSRLDSVFEIRDAL